MKKTRAFSLSVSLFTLLFTTTAQTGPFSWTGEQGIASSTFQNLRPRVATNAAGDAVVLWGSTATTANYSAVGGTSGFSSPVQVTTPGMTLWVSDWIGSEMASDGNNVWVTAFGSNQGEWSVYGIGSADGGYTWGDTVRASLLSNPALYPTVDVGPTGPIIMYMEHNTNFSAPRYVTATSTNGGISFNAPTQMSSLFAPGEVCDCCPAHINSVGQDVFALFRNNDNNQRDMYMAFSANNGASYSAAVDVEPGSWSINGCPSSGASSMIFGDSIRYVWMSGQDGISRVYMGTMHRTTKQVGYTGVVYMDPGGGSQNFPVIAGNGDEFMIVWEYNPGGDKNVQFLSSTTGTTGVSAPQNAHTSTTGLQTNPDLTWHNDTYHLVWSDASTGTIRYRTAFPAVVSLDVKVFLQGPFDGTSLMSDDLRSLAQFPLTEPYTALGFTHVGEGGGESISASVLATTGNDAIVDWVFLELRDKFGITTVLNTKSVLVQRDGDIVDLDGVSPVTMSVPGDSYYVVVHHRNHLPVMRSSSVALSTSSVVSLDFTAPATGTFGTDAQMNVNGNMVLWSGNAVPDDVIKYTGASNDRDAILVKIGGSVPTATAVDYSTEDINMDGVIKYTGANNDRDPILVNVGGSVPTATRLGQVP